MRTTRRITRPRSAACVHCGEPISLIPCGVPEHRRTRTRREQIEGRCPGYAYAHDATGGMECAGMTAEAEA